MDRMPVLPGWKTEQLFCEETTGSLYVIRRDQADKREAASLKLINVNAERKKDDDPNDTFFNEMASACLDNQTLVSRNIVHYDDIRYARHQDGTGCDILVKTELLVPVSKKYADGCSDDQVIKLAKDICAALIVCEKYGIIHGNIDLSNIFVFGNETYKLGNVGIDRVFAKYNKTKRSGCSAPEVAKGVCDNRSDIYSLGLVMRKLLGAYRLWVKATDSSKSVRLNDRLQEIIAKACSVDADKRYQTARQMLDALESIKGMVPRVRKSFKWVIKIFSIIIAIALSIALLAQIVWLYYSRCLRSSDHEHDYSYLNSNQTKHWMECQCGDKTKVVYHTYSTMKGAESHWEECTCGRIKNYSSHILGTWKTVIEATEETEGLQESVCKVCQYKARKVINKFAHVHDNPDEWSWDEYTHWKDCGTCGEKNESASHVYYGSWQVTKEATIYDVGVRERICEICQYVEIEVIPKIPHTHSYSGTWIFDNTSHWYECSCGEKIDIAVHSYGSWRVTKEATIYETGMRERTCKKCGQVDKETIQSMPHTHSYTGVWISNGTTHWHQCSCGAKNSVAFHTYGDWIVIEEATSFTDGRKRRICSVCGYWQTVTIPAN